MQIPEFRSFREFYPFYLGEHSNPTCRQLHFLGTSCVVALLVSAFVTRNWSLLAWTPLAGYGFAWLGHFVFEKNRPATFKHPLYSLMADFVMYRDLWMGRVPFRGEIRSQIR